MLPLLISPSPVSSGSNHVLLVRRRPSYTRLLHYCISKPDIGEQHLSKPVVVVVVIIVVVVSVGAKSATDGLFVFRP